MIVKLCGMQNGHNVAKKSMMPASADLWAPITIVRLKRFGETATGAKYRIARPVTYDNVGGVGTLFGVVVHLGVTLDSGILGQS